MLQWLYSFDYGDHVVKSVMATTYAKKRLSSFLVNILTLILRIHITFLCCMFISINEYADFFLHGSISIFWVLKSHWIRIAIETQDAHIFSVTEYIITNYTPQKYRNWKRALTLVTSLYLIFILFLFKIDNQLLIICILQYLFCFFVIDQIEEKKYEILLERFRNREKRILYEKVNVVDDYLESDFGETEEEKIGFVVIDNHFKRD